MPVDSTTFGGDDDGRHHCGVEGVSRGGQRLVGTGFDDGLRQAQRVVAIGDRGTVGVGERCELVGASIECGLRLVAERIDDPGQDKDLRNLTASVRGRAGQARGVVHACAAGLVDLPTVFAAGGDSQGR